MASPMDGDSIPKFFMKAVSLVEIGLEKVLTHLTGSLPGDNRWLWIILLGSIVLFFFFYYSKTKFRQIKEKSKSFIELVPNIGYMYM